MTAAKIETTAERRDARDDHCDVSIVLPPDFRLESGESLSRPELRLRIHGDLSMPVVVAAGGISSGRAVVETADDKGWWRALAGRGAAIDLRQWCLVGFDFLPNSDETARTISTKDQARALGYALDVLKVPRLFAFVGASYGGMTALAFADLFPGRVDRLCVISAAEKPHPAATAVRGVQRRIIAFANRCGAAEEGVSLARQLAMITYRTPEEFQDRFDTVPGPAAGDLYPVCEYLSARGAAYDMDAKRYLTLSDSIDRHCADPRRIRAETLLVAARSDRLVPKEDMHRVARGIEKSQVVEIDSLYGHDAFLKESSSIGPFIKHFLQESHK